MKKKTFKAIAIVMAIVSVLGLTACRKTEQPIGENDDPGSNVETGDFEDDDIVEYYGCPNSKRVRKLSLTKK